MALATRCPHCHTIFRVVQDQLKLYAGIVRCGVCQQVFNGADYLVKEEDAATATVAVSEMQAAAADQSVVPPLAAPITVEASAMGSDLQDWPAEDSELTAVETSQEDAPVFEPEEAPSPDFRLNDDHEDFRGASLEQADGLALQAAEDDLPVISLDLEDSQQYEDDLAFHKIDLPLSFDISEPERFGRREPKLEPELVPMDETGSYAEKTLFFDLSPETPPYNQQAIDAYLTRPEPSSDLPATVTEPAAVIEPVAVAEPASVPATSEPEFVKKTKDRQKLRRIARILFAIGSLILLALLALQGIYVFHDRIVARMPAAKPVVAEICAILECETRLSADIDELTIESSELQAWPKRQNTFTLDVVLRNRASSAQAWPSIELALSDESGQVAVRRILSPTEYLAETSQAAIIEKGLPPWSEQAIKLTFALDQVKAAGYRVYLFYP